MTNSAVRVRDAPPHGLARYRSKSRPCRCADCRSANAASSARYKAARHGAVLHRPASTWTQPELPLWRG